MIARKCIRGLHFQDDLVCAACPQQDRCRFYKDIYMKKENELIVKMKKYVETHPKYQLEVYLMGKKTSKNGKYIIVNEEQDIIGLKTMANIKKMNSKDLEGNKVMKLTTVYKPVYKITLVSSSFDKESSASGTNLSERKTNTKYGIVKKKKIIDITTYNDVIKSLKKGKKYSGCKFIKINAVQEIRSSVTLKTTNLTIKDVKNNATS